MRGPRVLPAAALAVGIGVVGTGPAQAAPIETSVPYRCVVGVFASTYEAAALQSIPVTIDAPAAVPEGEDLVVSVALAGPTPENAPFPLEDVVLQGRPDVDVRVAGGAGSWTSGSGQGAPSEPVDLGPYAQIPVGTPIDVTLPTADATQGSVLELRPGALRIAFLDGADGVGELDTDGVVCLPEPTPQPVTTVTVGAPVEIPSGAVGGLGAAALVGVVGVGVLLLRSVRARMRSGRAV